MDLLQSNGNSPTTDTSITENKMTRYKCQDAQVNPLLCECRWSQDEGTKTPSPVQLEQFQFTDSYL